MKSVAILTPSFRPDFDRLVRLHKSIIEFTDDSVLHHVIVPRRDVALFRSLAAPRMRVWAEADFLPAGFVATDGVAATIKKVRFLPAKLRFSALNVRRPWPPIRGWVLQQLLKLSASTKLDVDAVVIIDSDVALLRPMPAETFFKDGAVRTYEKPGAITPGMHRHLIWTRAAHSLLGLPAPGSMVHPDYVAGIISWDPHLVAGCLARIEEVSGKPWAAVVGSQLHFSEFILYGTYVSHFGNPQQRSFTQPTTLCHSYWDTAPLTGPRVEEFIAGFGELDVAVHIQSNSATNDKTTEHVLESLRSRINS